MSDAYDIARRIWGRYEYGAGAADDVRSVQADAWVEGWNACAEWWEIHHHEAIRDEQNPHAPNA